MTKSSEGGDRRLPGTQLADSVVRLASHPSIEITPGQVPSIPAIARALPGASVFVTSLPNSDPTVVLEASRALHASGLHPVPHLAARNIRSAGELDELVGDLVRVGVDEVLVIAGSRPAPVGSLGDSFAVLESGVLGDHGIRKVAIGGYPEGIPGIEDSVVADAMLRKQQWAAEAGVELRIVTQFCFDGDAMTRFASPLPSSVPVTPGLAGLTSPFKLLRYAVSCGIGPSLSILRRQTASITRLTARTSYRPDQVVLDLARAAADGGAAFAGLHLFPFGDIDRTVAYLAALRSGEFRIDEQRRAILTD